MDRLYKMNSTVPNITYTNDTLTIGDSNSYSVRVNSAIETYINRELLKKVFECEDEIKEELKAEKDAAELKRVQERNERLRGLIEKVTFSGPVTVVKWSDGTITRVRCADGETYDQEKGLLAAMAKKLYENTNIFVEELANWCEQPEKDDYEDYINTLEDEDWARRKDWF